LLFTVQAFFMISLTWRPHPSMGNLALATLKIYPIFTKLNLNFVKIVSSDSHTIALSHTQISDTYFPCFESDMGKNST
jgi:hypothetical protein